MLPCIRLSFREKTITPFLLINENVATNGAKISEQLVFPTTAHCALAQNRNHFLTLNIMD